MGMFEAARKLLKKINDLGYEAYIVGGAVRDRCLGGVSSDVDIATNCPLDILRAKLKTHEITKKMEFEHLDFGVLLVSFGSYLFDVAHFRSEKGYDGRHPSEIKLVRSLEEDVQRRDFTINALAMDGNGKIIDLVGGLEDLKRKIIRAVGDPEKRFAEDYLRMMRAARFASKPGFTLDKNTRKAARKLAPKIVNISAERIGGEIIKAASFSMEFAQFIRNLIDLKLLQRVLPEIDALRYLKHSPKHHPEGPTVMDHVLATIESITWYDNSEVILAALFHDVGKGISLTESDGLYHYHRHEKASASMAEEIMKRLKFPTSLIEPVVFASENHMLFRHMEEMKKAKVARIISSPHFTVLVELVRADDLSRGDAYFDSDQFEKLVDNLWAIKAKWEKFLGEKPLNLVNGNRIMELTGLSPCRQVGDIKKQVENQIIEESIDPTDQNKIDSIVLEVFNGNVETT